jgi:hypothetical protein
VRLHPWADATGFCCVRSAGRIKAFILLADDIDASDIDVSELEFFKKQARSFLKRIKEFITRNKESHTRYYVEALFGKDYISDKK